MTVARHLRMTEADKLRKIRKQRERRLSKPSVNGRLRIILGDQDYQQLYDRLYTQQKGKCGICRKQSKRRFHMDHDHKTLEIRGLLCYSCNTKLGFVEKHMKRIRRYLEGKYLC